MVRGRARRTELVDIVLYDRERLCWGFQGTGRYDGSVDFWWMAPRNRAGQDFMIGSNSYISQQ